MGLLSSLQGGASMAHEPSIGNLAGEVVRAGADAVSNMAASAVADTAGTGPGYSLPRDWLRLPELTRSMKHRLKHHMEVGPTSSDLACLPYASLTAGMGCQLKLS